MKLLTFYFDFLTKKITQNNIKSKLKSELIIIVFILLITHYISGLKLYSILHILKLDIPITCMHPLGFA